MAGATLNEKGWHLSEEGIELCAGENSKKVEKIIEVAKNTDLKEIGEKWLPDDVNKGSCEYVEGKGVLQIQKIRNIAAPKENEESQGAPRLLKVTLTDGQLTCNGVEIENLEKFGLNVPPGTKVLLKGTVAVEHGILLLNNKNCQLIGGRVEKLAESWELKKMLSKQSKQRGTTEGGPPPYVPFGHRIQDSRGANPRENFKALAPKKEEKKKEEGDFEKQRQATIAEALQGMEEKPKAFGGGQKQGGSDFDIAKIMEMGFTAEQANSALKFKNGNFQLAVNHLVQGRGGARENKFGGGGGGRQALSGGREQQGRPQREDRRENRGRRQRDEESEEVSLKPSAPATLFDFLSQSKKIPVDSNKENKENKDSKSSYVPSKSMQYSNDGSKPNDRGYKPKYQDLDSRNDRKSDTRPKSGPAYNSQKSYSYDDKKSYGYNDKKSNSYDDKKSNSYNDKKFNSYDDKPQRQNSAGDRTRDKYNNREQGNRSQQNNDRNNSRQNRSDGNSASSRQNYNNDRTGRNESSQNYSRQDQVDRRTNYGDRNSQDSRRSNQNNNNNHDRQFDGRNQNYNERGAQNDRSQRQYKNDRGPPNDRGQNQGRDDRNYNRRNPGADNSSRSEQKDNSYSDRPQGKGKYQNNDQGYSNEYNSKKSASNNTQYQPPSQGRVWNQGEPCLAKYWEDNQFYNAVISQCSSNTAVVFFCDYGNYEEVNLSDIKPVNGVPMPDFSVPPPGMFYNMPVPQPTNQPMSGSQIPSMEFRRKKPDNDKPTMQYYQPPKQRNN